MELERPVQHHTAARNYCGGGMWAFNPI